MILLYALLALWAVEVLLFIATYAALAERDGERD